MRRFNLFVFISILTLTTGLFSCSDEYFAKKYTFEHHTWNKNQKVVFDFKSTAKNKFYDFFIELETNTKYPFSNMYLFTTFIDRKKNSFTDTLMITLADHTGRWLGKGFFSKTLRIPLKENALIKEPSDYRLVFRHGMRVNKLEGVVSIGLIIQPKEKKHDN